MNVAVLNSPAPAPTALPTRLVSGPFVVTTERLAKRYWRETALGGVDLQVPEGAVYVLAGANGAGKSTLLRTLLNLVRADEGRAEVFGLDTATNGPAIRAGLGYVPETTQAGYPWMKAGQLLAYHAAFHPGWDADYAARLCRMLDVRPERRVGSLSKGQSRRLQLVMALAHRPRLLLLDEPTDGLDPVVRDEVMGLLSEHLADTGCTILISTHLVYEVERIADHLGVLRDGRLVVQAPREELHRRLRAYRAEGPEGCVGPASVPGAVLSRNGAGRDIRWTVWGEESAISTHFERSGAVVRDVSPLTLDQAVVTLLSAKEPW
jgi:ABC-2 type transport system ATP-binding protein